MESLEGLIKRPTGKKTEDEVVKVPNCFICMDKGFILYQELVEWYTAEKVARCTCEKGNEYRYEGQECTKNKSNYRIPVITEIMDPVEIAQSNYAKWYERNKNKKGFQEALEEIKMRKG